MKHDHARVSIAGVDGREVRQLGAFVEDDELEDHPEVARRRDGCGANRPEDGLDR